MSPGTPLRRLTATLSLAAANCAWALAPGPASAASSGPSAPVPPPRVAPPAAATGYAPDEAIVRFEAGAPANRRQEAKRAAGASFAGTFGLPRAQVVSVEGPVGAAVRRLERQPGVAYAQPNYVYEATALEPPNDTFFDRLWGLSDPALPDAGVGALDAWEAGKEGEGEVIAILDTGVDLTHPDLVDNLWDNPSPSKGDGHGYDFVDDDPDPDDYNFHGTHVAGTAAATAGNGVGIAGVAPSARIMAVRVLDGDGSGSTADIAAGIDYATDNGADVLNMSLGGPADEDAGDRAMEDAITRAGEADAVVVVAAGNEEANNDTEPHTPCALPNANLICVAALTESGGLAGFSNYGTGTVDIAAPGTGVLSTKADYGEPLLSEGFESGLAGWESFTSNGGVPWNLHESAASGEQSATDSPVGNYGNALLSSEAAVSEVFTADPVDLAAGRGCRVHFRTRFQIEQNSDLFAAGAFSELPFIDDEHFDERFFNGQSLDFSKGNFIRAEASISDLDGREDVHPEFAILSDEAGSADGAYVDDIRLICRDGTYEDKVVEKISDYDLPDSGNYVNFNGTSMATPHVAGVVALVRAAAPGLNPTQAIDAVLDGASAIPKVTAGRRTATEGIADACKAVALATGAEVASECPASSEPEPQPEVIVGGGEVVTAELQEPLPSTSTAAAPVEPRADRSAPNTAFRRRPPKVLRTPRRRAKAIFRFRSNEPAVTFLCQFDRKRYRRCGVRFVRWFRIGRHVLRVKARDGAGNVDRTPAVSRFRVRRVRR